MMDRRERITRFITPQQKGIEIGPYFTPLAPKRAGYNCLAVDVFDAATLRRRAAEDPEIPDEMVPNIEEVDLLGSSSAIAELLAEKYQLGTFDYIISSHNFEHLPDPVRFLQGCNKVLRTGGILSMAVPDRRTCFDYFRPHSTLAEMLDAYFARRECPTLAQWFEQKSLQCRYGAQGITSFPLDADPSEIVGYESLVDALSEWQELVSRPSSEYRDAHCWTFTPASFELILRDLDFLNLIAWEVIDVSETSGNEFYVNLWNRGEVAREVTSGEFYRQRRELLHRMIDEMGENSVRSYQLRQLLERVAGQREIADELRIRLRAMEESTSWRMTAPLRTLSTALRRFARRAL